MTGFYIKRKTRLIRVKGVKTCTKENSYYYHQQTAQPTIQWQQPVTCSNLDGTKGQNERNTELETLKH